jgi:small conductance mechanosensitive channel
MEQQANNLILATRTALDQASAIGVQYAFSVTGALVLSILGWVFARIVSRWAYEGISRIRGMDETLARFFANVLYYGLLILVFVTVLGQFGVQTASIIATLGAAGIAIGLALQGTLQNIAAGIMLLILRPFRVGEYIETGSVSGTVREIGLFATELRTSDGLYRLAPNSTLWNTPITNYSREPTRRHEITISVAAKEDLAVVLDTLLSLAKDEPSIQQRPEPQAFVNSLGDGVSVVTLQYWVTLSAWAATTREMYFRTKAALDAKGIGIA